MLHFRFERKLILIVATLFAACAIMALALSPAVSGEMRPLLQSLGIISCSSANPCQEGSNASTGPGLEGISAKGKGVIGLTNFRSTSSSNGQAGVLGQDSSTSGTNDAGVKGNSPKGFGVLGTSTSGTAVEGVSSSGVGGQFGSTNARGMIVTSTNDDGIDAFTSHNSTTSGFGRYGVIGSDASTDGGHLNVGVLGASSNGPGVSAVSANFIGEEVTGGGQTSTAVYPALSVNGNTNASELVDACNSSGPNPCRSDAGQPAPQFELFADGGIVITGKIFTSGSCSSGCAPSPSSGEKRVQLFTPQESLPTVEDLGEAQLTGGRTYVRIDRAFANTMDGRAAYMVVITPEGDSNGLYVINKTAAGFEVHENRGGRSTLAFSYRIVAKPFGEHPVRLQMITVSKPGTSLPASRVR